jgi:hypothetical protein
MPRSSQGGKARKWRWLGPVADGLSKLRNHSSSQVAQSVSGAQQATGSLTSQFPQISTLGQPASPDCTPDVSAPIAASSVPSGKPNPLHNEYVAIGGLAATPPGPPTRGQRMKEAGSTVYAGLTTIVQGLYDCSDMFLPLKTAAGVFLTISNITDVRKTYVNYVETNFHNLFPVHRGCRQTRRNSRNSKPS